MILQVNFAGFVQAPERCPLKSEKIDVFDFSPYLCQNPTPVNERSCLAPSTNRVPCHHVMSIISLLHGSGRLRARSIRLDALNLFCHASSYRITTCPLIMCSYLTLDEMWGTIIPLTVIHSVYFRTLINKVWTSPLSDRFSWHITSGIAAHSITPSLNYHLLPAPPSYRDLTPLWSNSRAMSASSQTTTASGFGLFEKLACALYGVEQSTLDVSLK